jgi:hypothetical protein
MDQLVVGLAQHRERSRHVVLRVGDADKRAPHSRRERGGCRQSSHSGNRHGNPGRGAQVEKLAEVPIECRISLQEHATGSQVVFRENSRGAGGDDATARINDISQRHLDLWVVVNERECRRRRRERLVGSILPSTKRARELVRRVFVTVRGTVVDPPDGLPLES